MPKFLNVKIVVQEGKLVSQKNYLPVLIFPAKYLVISKQKAFLLKFCCK